MNATNELKEWWDPPGKSFRVDELAHVHLTLSGSGSTVDLPIFIEIFVENEAMQEPMKLIGNLGNANPHGPDGQALYLALEAGLRSAADTLAQIRELRQEIY